MITTLLPIITPVVFALAAVLSALALGFGIGFSAGDKSGYTRCLTFMEKTAKAVRTLASPDQETADDAAEWLVSEGMPASHVRELRAEANE